MHLLAGRALARQEGRVANDVAHAEQRVRVVHQIRGVGAEGLAQVRVVDGEVAGRVRGAGVDAGDGGGVGGGRVGWKEGREGEELGRC